MARRGIVAIVIVSVLFLVLAGIGAYFAIRSLLSSSSSSSPSASSSNTLLRAYPFLTNFDAAVGIRQRADNDRFYYVWTQTGQVWRVDKQTGDRIVVLDKKDEIVNGVFGGNYNFGSDERGLLGVAFHPNSSLNQVFVSYSAPKADKNDRETNHIARLSSFRIAGKDTIAEKFVDESIVLDIPQQESYHHAQSLEFNPRDGFLYYSVGDGGPQGDLEGHAQNLHDLRGKILRIDVNPPLQQSEQQQQQQGEKRKPYGIPATNPFVNAPEKGRPEIIALGLRNPWRFSVEDGGNRLFIADVGWNTQESIKILQLPQDAREKMEQPVNFGWPVYEGDSRDGNVADLAVTPWTKPAFTYRTGGALGRATVGGYLLSSSENAQANQPKKENAGRERYVFGDFVSGKLAVIEHDAKKGNEWKLIQEIAPQQLFASKVEVSSEDAAAPAQIPNQRPLSPDFVDSKKNVSALGRDLQNNLFVIAWSQKAQGDEKSAIYLMKT